MLVLVVVLKFTLPGVDNELAIYVLMALSNDKWSSVRSWVVFGLGSLIERGAAVVGVYCLLDFKDMYGEIGSEVIVGLVV